jgi:hypothetical protein
MEQEQINVKKMNEDLQHLKKEVAELKEIIKDDLEFSKKVDEAWEEFDKGEFIEMDGDEFIEDLKKW